MIIWESASNSMTLMLSSAQAAEMSVIVPAVLLSQDYTSLDNHNLATQNEIWLVNCVKEKECLELVRRFNHNIRDISECILYIVLSSVPRKDNKNVKHKTFKPFLSEDFLHNYFLTALKLHGRRRNKFTQKYLSFMQQTSDTFSKSSQGQKSHSELIRSDEGLSNARNFSTRISLQWPKMTFSYQLR